ncbi:uncharacterized protein LOC127651800 [Xyrauchen texanus]|uniref:uncharacterized protein LOC127651800 n=1 Tax=Xyrauchen texanus TaxID=154827 RepID=UPI0022423EC1|nr:uncharacterized protein LOC127651800 [Xyrauchen texanus]XP_051993787.1 uncharacterized protein LOC127651800 [Xyrauchen texanus]
MSTPSPTAFLTCKCVATKLSQRAQSFTKGRKIDIGRFKTQCLSALSDGSKTYLNKKDGFTREFEEGVSYVLQKHTISNAYGQIHLFVGPGTLKFKMVPMEITEEAMMQAKHALCPASPLMSGEEQDIFSQGGYLSLQGKIIELCGTRMTRTNVPILDMRLQCGGKAFDVSLWRDEALTDLYVGDEVVLTHLRPCIFKNGQRKFQSSAYTSVQIPEGQVEETEVDIIGVSEVNDTCTFLSSESEVFIVPSTVFSGNPDDLIDRLPMKHVLKHLNRRVLQIRERESSAE